MNKLLNFLQKLNIVSSSDISEQAKAITLQQQQQNSNNNQVQANGIDAYNTGGMWSPGHPLNVNGNIGKPPWRYQFRVGGNLTVTPRAEYNLISFATLRETAKYDLIALCINMMMEQVVGDAWDIVVADKTDTTDYSEDIKKWREFFMYPDKEHPYTDWIKPYLYDSLSIDAPCLFKRRTRSGKLYPPD